MFRLKKHDEPIKWPVHVSEPQDGGTTKKRVFNAHFQLLPQADVDGLVQNGDEEFMLKVIKGWDGVQDADGNDMPCTEENIKLLVGVSYIKAALVEAYFKMQVGSGRKN